MRDYSLPALELHGVGLTYPAVDRQSKATDALRDFSLVVEPGHIVGLAGPNGAGKTSLLEICIGALAPTRGNLSWFGSTVLSSDVRRRIGFCPDVPSFPRRMTGRELLRLFAALDGVPTAFARKRIELLAERLRLQDALGKRVESMSRGTAVRLGMLQAIVCERDLLLCDETFSPLDPAAQVDLREVLREEANRGAAVLVSSHQLEQLAKVADAVAIMRTGGIVRYLNTDALKARGLLVLDIDGLDGRDVALVAGGFDGAWRSGPHLMVPWASDEWDEIQVRRSLPAVATGIRIVGLTAFSLESVFLAAMNES